MSSMQDHRPRVCLLAAPETSGGLLYGLFDVLLSAGASFEELTRGEINTPLLDVQIVAAQAGLFHCFGGVPVQPHACIDDVHESDVVVVCDMYLPPDGEPRGLRPREVAWLRTMHARGALVAGVCTGALVLAEAGLLDGCEATAHWAYRDMIRTAYPQVKLREEAILCLAGDPQRVVTAAGTTAWEDLALCLIARLAGVEHAIRAAKVHLLASHTEGQLPYAAMTRHIQRSDAVIADAQAWIAKHYANPNPVGCMARRAGLASRTFTRRFRVATGYRPIDYVHALRIEEARQLLELGQASVDEVGVLVGYEDEASFRRLFKRKAGLTPAAYRRKFAHLGAA